MDKIALIRFSPPFSVDIVNSTFLEALAEDLSNEMHGDFSVGDEEFFPEPQISYSAGKISVEWGFDSDVEGINSELIRLQTAVFNFLVDHGCFSTGMQFFVSVEENYDE